MIAGFKFYAALSLLFAVVPLFSQSNSGKIILEDAVASGRFSQQSVNEIRSMKDGDYYTILDGGKYIIQYSYSTGLPFDTLFSTQKITSAKINNISEYQFNDQETEIIISTNIESLYRHSFVAEYFIYNCINKSIQPLSVNGKQQLATFSPNGDKVAFVRDNNIFVVDLHDGTESQITSDGKFNNIINGKPDWVYEEEFGFTKGFCWSPDSKKLAYLRFDESRVKTINMPIYENLYPSEYSYKYPKAGETNSTVTVWVMDVISGLKKIMDVGKDSNQYIPQIKWANSNKLCIVRLNRHQNQVDILFSDILNGQFSLLYTETNKRFISEIGLQYLTILDDGTHFLVSGERSGFNHLYRYTMDGKLVNPVTHGAFDVDKILDIDQKNGVVYYTGTAESPLDRDVYSVKVDGTDLKRISTQKGTNMAEFSKTFSYYINKWSDVNTPTVASLYNSHGKLIRVLQENEKLKKEIKSCGFQKVEFIQVPSDTLLLNGFMIKPANFDSKHKYPVFMYVYGGPESQEVKNAWNTRSPWFEYLAQQGYIVVCVDNRGTDGRGENFRKCTYLQLGKLETIDQINTAKYLAQLPYVDGSRIGIFGWSYGGYMTSLCMTRGKGIFKMGIAVAPIINWRFYDSVYTERFLLTPQENASGYDDNSPLTYAHDLQGKFLLVHGSADDNVHFQNSMMFADKLIQANKKFDMAIYPNKNHGIYGDNTRLHLYTKMTDYIIMNL